MKDKITLKEACSIPNLLCYVRILLIPLFIWCYMTAVRPEDYYIAAVIVFGGRIFDNFAVIRRLLIERLKSRKRGE